MAVSGFLPGGGEFFLEISSGGGDNLPGGGEKIALQALPLSVFCFLPYTTLYY